MQNFAAFSISNIFLRLLFEVLRSYNLAKYNDIFSYFTQSLQKDDQSNARGQEVLRVRAYGSSYFTLQINIRFAFSPCKSRHNFV